MNRLRLPLLLVACLLGSLACRRVDDGRDPEVSLTLDSITVIDVVSGEQLANHCVEISGHRILSVAPCAREVATKVGESNIIDGTGLFLIPGLWDMHVHLTDATEIALPALISFGVTTVRDMGGDLELIDAWRSEIEAGVRTGPRIFRAGPVLDGPKPGAPYRVTISQPGDARSALADLIDRGVDHVKIHNAVPRDAYFSLLEAAKSRGVKVVGHVPATVSPIEAVDAGQASVEHIATIFEGTFNARFSDPLAALEAMESFPEAGAVELARHMVSKKTAFTPTMVAYESRARRAALAANPDSRRAYVALSLLEQWDRFFPVTERDADDAVIAARRRAYQAWARSVARMHQEGVSVVAGTDLGARDVYPDSLHDELAALVDAGFSPLEALQAATITAEQTQLGSQSLTVVRAGAVADLVVLDGNPLNDIRHSRGIAAVIARGKYYDRETLDLLLDRVEVATATH